jgi:GNAT superfamily N-acetyltransferase
MIQQISWSEIFEIWSEKLWPQRNVQTIEPFSAMLLSGGYGSNQSYSPTFWGYMRDSAIVGVNSGHACVDGSYRSRGLWVDPEYRNQGIGRNLLLKALEQAENENTRLCWSLPRKTSWPTYQSAGFELCSDWFQTETSDANAYCVKHLVK